VKATVKTGRFPWLKSVDKNLKSHPKQFWKYVSQFKKKSTDLIRLDVDGVLNKPRDIAEAFSKYFQSVYSSSCYGTSSLVNQCAEILHLAPISNPDVLNAVKQLRPSKSDSMEYRVLS
jgi:hypothetical protein